MGRPVFSVGSLVKFVDGTNEHVRGSVVVLTELLPEGRWPTKDVPAWAGDYVLGPDGKPRDGFFLECVESTMAPYHGPDPRA